MTLDVKTDLKQKIKIALQNIQDNVEEGTKGLDRHEVNNDMVFWELGLLLREFVESKFIPKDRIEQELVGNLHSFRRIEKKVRSDGLRKGKEALPSWFYKNQKTKKMQEPSETWVLWSWEFVNEYQDEERWKLVVKLAGGMWEEGFVRKRAQDLLRNFSKREPIPKAKQLQTKFIEEMEKFEKPPSRQKDFEPLIQKIFGKSKINYNSAKSHFLRIMTDVGNTIDKETGGDNARKEFTKSIGSKPIESLRRLLRLISITDKDKFEKRLANSEVKKLGKTITTKHPEAKELYEFLYSLKAEDKSRKYFLGKVSGYQLATLNTTLGAVSSEDAYLEYQENLKTSDAFFS